MTLANIMGGDGLIVVVIVIAVLFGGSQLPKIARNLGSAGKEFRKGQEESEEEARKQEAAKGKVDGAPRAVPPAPTPVPPVAAAPADDRVTLSKAELNALLDEREARARETNN
jgi:sec-independent protein translocase protein TatA